MRKAITTVSIIGIIITIFYVVGLIGSYLTLLQEIRDAVVIDKKRELDLECKDGVCIPKGYIYWLRLRCKDGKIFWHKVSKEEYEQYHTGDHYDPKPLSSRGFGSLALCTQPYAYQGL